MKTITAKGIGKTYSIRNAESKHFEALKNISFSVEKGESVGIIGRNGAGKSTLLKLLSGIILPSTGSAEMHGTFSSLIEVGTGFHPDLTGRENIFLNGSIIGISKKEIKAQLETIIAFSGVGHFIDQSLKTYSSGMKLRLAFSVIAHLKTDIIALDEVLAVGDSMFQVKCMERIFDFKKEGKTILFVSHNMSAIKKLCDRTIVLEQGKIVFDGNTSEAIAEYMTLNQNPQTNSLEPYIKEVVVTPNDKTCTIKLMLQNLPSGQDIDLGININTAEGICLYHFSNRFIDIALQPNDGMLNPLVKFEHKLKPGTYAISIFIGQNEAQLAWHENVCSLEIPPSNPYGFHNPDAIQGPMITDFTMSTD
ncbi:polysaccharide ABC transporter ATP-binding protein [Bacteroidota bacterium]